MTPVSVIQFVSVFLLALFALANLTGIEKLWGINFLKFHELPWSFIALLSCLVLFVPGISKRIADTLNEFGRTLLENHQLRLLSFGFIGLGAFSLFLIFSSTATLLGDGSLRINQIESGQFWLATEPLDFFLHAILYKLIFRPLGSGAEFCYRIISALSGILFLFGAFKLSVYLNPKKWPLGFLVMTSSGLMILFFGYVESYSPAAALMPFLFLAGLKAIDGAGSKSAFIVLLIIAGLFHLVIALIFSLAFLFILLSGRFSKTIDSNWVMKVFLIFITAIVAVLYAVRSADIGNLERYLLGILPNSANPQSVFSQNHWLNILNWILTAALPALALAPALMKQKSVDNLPLPKRHFVLLCVVPSMLFVLVFTPQLGGPRDWDLFSLPAFLLMMSILALYHLNSPGGLPYQILPVIAISIWTIIGFAGVNASSIKSSLRQEEIIEISRFRNHYKDYANLLRHIDNVAELGGKRIEYARKAWNEPPLTKGDSVYILNRLSELALEQNNKESARGYLSLAVTTDSTSLYSHLLWLNFSNLYESRERVFENANLISRRFPDNPEALSALGVVYSQADSNQKALTLYERAFQLDSARFDIIQNFAILLYQNSKTDRGLELLRRACEIGPDSFLINYHLSAAHHQAGNTDSSQYYFTRVNALSSTFQRQQLLYQLHLKISDSASNNEGKK